jgi:hypothetical protein
MKVKSLLAIALCFGGILLSFQSAVARDSGKTYDLRREALERKIQKSQVLTQEQKDRRVAKLRRHFDRVKRLALLNDQGSIAESDLQSENDSAADSLPCVEEDGAIQESLPTLE